MQKILVFFKKNSLNFQKCFILLFVYILFSLIICFGFSNKLNTDEFNAVKDIYTEMRYVNGDIKSDFYVNNLIKVLDKSYILDELRNDSLIYTVTVSQNAFTMLSYGDTSKEIVGYLNRCNLNFKDFVNLDNTVSLFNLNLEFFQSFTDDVENLEIFSKKMNEIIENEESLLQESIGNRYLICFLAILSYVSLLIIWIKRGKKK